MRMKPSQLLKIAAVMWCAACEDRGVEEPERFFQSNKAFLEKTVSWLKETRTEVVWPNTDFANAKRQDSTTEDELFYNEIQQFMRTTRLLSVNALWLPNQNQNERRFIGATFLAKQKQQGLDATKNVSIVYVVSGESLDGFFRNKTCRLLNRPAWHLCEWTPA